MRSDQVDELIFVGDKFPIPMRGNESPARRFEDRLGAQVSDPHEG